MPFTAADLVTLHRVTDYAVSPDGGRVVVAVQRLDPEGSKYISQLVEVSHGEVRPLHLGKWTSSRPRFDDHGVLHFSSNRDPEADPEEEPKEDARSQVWRLEGDKAVRLTDEPLGVTAFDVAGPHLVVITAELPGIERDAQRSTVDDRKKNGPSQLRYTSMPVRFWDHWLPASVPVVVRYAGEERLELCRGPELREASWSLSDDGSTFAISTAHYRDRMEEKRIAVFDVASGERRHELGGDHRSWLTSPVLSNDGSHIVFVEGAWEEGAHGPQRLARVDLASGERTLLAPEWDRWLHPAVLRDDGSVLGTADHLATTPVWSVDTDATELTDGRGTCSHVRVAAGRLWFVRADLLSPPEVYSMPLGGGPIRQETTLSGAPDLAGEVKVTDHVVSSPSGHDVQYRVVWPAQRSGPVPTVLWIHGGPISSWSDTWHWRWCSAVLASQGMAVVLPNPSGSTGFGQDLIEAVWGNIWGAACFADVMAVADAVEAHDDVDAEKVYAMGGSFGGYMTNWIGTQTDRFRALVTHASLFHFDIFHATTDAPWFWRHQLGLDPWKDVDALGRYSPARHIGGWKTPTLVIHGEKDYRVPISEGLALFEGLQAHGVHSELLVFPDENHWVLKPRNIQAWYGAVQDWLGRY